MMIRFSWDNSEHMVNFFERYERLRLNFFATSSSISLSL